MPKKKSAFKELRKVKKRRLVNLARGSELRTLTKKLETLIAQKKVDEAKAHLKELFSKIDMGASKGFIHKNTASRRKARLAKKLEGVSTKA